MLLVSNTFPAGTEIPPPSEKMPSVLFLLTTLLVNDTSLLKEWSPPPFENDPRVLFPLTVVSSNDKPSPELEIAPPAELVALPPVKVRLESVR